jgi:hypothetical protein
MPIILNALRVSPFARTNTSTGWLYNNSSRFSLIKEYSALLDLGISILEFERLKASLP